MSETTSHYSLSLEPMRLVAAANEVASTLLGKLELGEIPVLAYRGMSGIAAAVALGYALQNKGSAIGMIYVRKRGENSHGEHIESSLPSKSMAERFVLVFVDDFISSGTTLRAVREDAGGLITYSRGLVALLGNEDGYDRGVYDMENYNAVS